MNRCKPAEPKLQQQEGKVCKQIICYCIGVVVRDAIPKSLRLRFCFQTLCIPARGEIRWSEVQSKLHICKTALLMRCYFLDTAITESSVVHSTIS